MPAAKIQPVTRPCSIHKNINFFANELTDTGIIGPDGEPVYLCKECARAAFTVLSQRSRVGELMAGEMTMGEVLRIRRERAASYARREVEVA